MDKKEIKEIIEKALEGSSADVDGSEGKFSANIVFDGYNGLNTIKRHKMVYNCLDSFIKSGELHAISLKTFTHGENKS
jgi:acid stress-induced BolA-like protein IbaG/YrbA